MDFRTITAGEKKTDFIGGPINAFRFALRSAVEEVDEAPGKILGIGLKCGVGEQSEEIAPYPGESLADRFLAGKIWAFFAAPNPAPTKAI